MIEFLRAQDPPTAPAPIPTVIVDSQVTIPPELLEKLTPPDPGVVSAAAATLISGGAILLAAILAFIGVLIVQRCTRRNLERQIGVEQGRHERTERVQVLVEAVEVLEHSKVLMKAYQRAKKTGEEIERVDSDLDSNWNRQRVVSARLQLHEMTSSYNAFQVAQRAISDMRKKLGTAEGKEARDTMLRDIASATDAFLSEMKTLSATPTKKAGWWKRTFCNGFERGKETATEIPAQPESTAPTSPRAG